MGTSYLCSEKKNSKKLGFQFKLVREKGICEIVWGYWPKLREREREELIFLGSINFFFSLSQFWLITPDDFTNVLSLSLIWIKTLIFCFFFVTMGQIIVKLRSVGLILIDKTWELKGVNVSNGYVTFWINEINLVMLTI